VENSGSGFSGSMLIIYDVNNDLFIQPEEMAAVKDFCLGGGYLIYLGNSKYQMISDAGIDGPSATTANSCFYHYYQDGRKAIYAGFCDGRKHLYADIEEKLSEYEKPAYAMLSEFSWDTKYFHE
jgi:hypothetical protein